MQTEAGRATLRVRRFAEPAPHRTIGLVWQRVYPFADAVESVDVVEVADPTVRTVVKIPLGSGHGLDEPAPACP